MKRFNRRVLVNIIACILCVLVVGAFMWPAETKHIVKPSPEQKQAYQAAQHAFATQMADVDNEFLAGNFEQVLSDYLKLKVTSSKWQIFDLMINCKIGACLEKLGRYPECLDWYRKSDQGSFSQPVLAEMTYLADKHGDTKRRDAFVAEARARWIDGVEDPRTQSLPVTVGCWTSNRDAETYLLFAACFGECYDRVGIDFAFSMATKLTNRDPNLIVAWSDILTNGVFDDPGAGYALLDTVSEPTDPELKSTFNYLKRGETSWKRFSKESQDHYRDSCQIRLRKENFEYGFCGSGIYN